MADNPEERQDEIDRIKAAADDMARLMNRRFVLDQAKLQAFTPSRDNSGLDHKKGPEPQ
jgi:hypothetical protein